MLWGGGYKMAGTVTKTETKLGTMKKVKFAWVSSAGGAADATTDEVYDGKIVQLVTVPSATAPTTLYDIAVTDSDSIDVLAGAGADRSATDTEYIAEASLGAVANSKLTLAITNAGAAKEGTVYLFIR